jgi:hypothetical protein
MGMLSTLNREREWCGDAHAFKLWLDENPDLKNEPLPTQAQAFVRFLTTAPVCSHRGCRGKRRERIWDWEDRAKVVS